jgi:hypothetical protein
MVNSISGLSESSWRTKMCGFWNCELTDLLVLFFFFLSTGEPEHASLVKAQREEMIPKVAQKATRKTKTPKLSAVQT